MKNTNIKIIVDNTIYHIVEASIEGCEDCDLLQYCSEHESMARTCDSISETDIWKKDDNNQ